MASPWENEYKLLLGTNLRQISVLSMQSDYPNKAIDKFNNVFN